MPDTTPIFDALGLKTFCELYVEVSVVKILEFYSNLNFYGDGHFIKFIRTSVNGVTLVYSALDVCYLYGCESTAEMQDFEKNEAFCIIVGHKVFLKNYMESTRLDICLRVLYHVVLFSLLHCAGSIDTIMPADAKVMVHLLEGIPFSLGALIFKHMEWSLSRREKSLSYGQKKTPSVTTAAKGKKHVKVLPASQKGSAPSAVEASASSALPSVAKELQLQVAKELQLQVAAQGEDIRVLQRLLMNAIRQLEGRDKFLYENLDA
ncbi:hypothetical protein MLD38_035371 [Melastoma candidum]|uniref:Uncharacterized protein n=1 Tax=Melastoma candidum TaxID=119954 RepID=A0ACB9LGH2_9MYRT|nr:hypothetical protein MLD38_035371 [Melastoma candidum]